MKKILIIFFLLTVPLLADKIERLGFYNLQEILEDDKLTYKIIKGCVSINSAVTELIKKEYPDLAEEFFQSANYLYPFGVLVLMKINNVSQQEAEKKYFFDVDTLTKDYIDFMKVNGVINKSFFKGTFIGDDLNFCNEIRAAIETTISESRKNN
tara:strand:- start:47 stop:508 length:462 start_codon:yes stop_codon:yes gene_type:complete